MKQKLQITKKLKGIGRVRRKSKRVTDAPSSNGTAERVPRIARLMALAFQCERLIDEGVVQDRAEIARLMHVSRARVTQVMNLLHLASDIQEEVLTLPDVTSGRDPVTERDLRAVVRNTVWASQRREWKHVKRSLND